MLGDGFNYLRIFPQTAKKIEHKQEYIKTFKDQTADRRIFKNVDYDDYEREQLMDFKKTLKRFQIEYNNKSQTDDILLRFLYSGNFNISSSVELFKRYLDWLTVGNPFSESNASKSLLVQSHFFIFIQQEGYIYLAGRQNKIYTIISRDKQYRPTLCVNAFLFKTSFFDSDAFLKAINKLLALCEEYMFYPGKIENIVVLIQAKEAGLYNFPYRQFQYIVLTLFQNFPQMLDRMYIFNPSQSLMLTWEYLSTFIDARTLQKIKIWNTDVVSPLALGYEAEQLECRFGGQMEDITQFWPPINTIKQFSRAEPDWKYQKALQQDQPFGFSQNESKMLDPKSFAIQAKSPLQGQNSLYGNPNELVSDIRQRELQERQEKEKLDALEKEINRDENQEKREKNLQLFNPLSEMFGLTHLPLSALQDQLSRPSELMQNKFKVSQLQKNSVLGPDFDEADQEQGKGGKLGQTKQGNVQFQRTPPGSNLADEKNPNFPNDPKEQKMQQPKFKGGAKSTGNLQHHPDQSEDDIKYEPPKLPLMNSEFIKPFSHKQSEVEKQQTFEQTSVQACIIM